MSKLKFAGITIAAAFIIGFIGAGTTGLPDGVFFWPTLIVGISIYIFFFSKNEWGRTKAQDVWDRIVGREVPKSNTSFTTEQKRILRFLTEIKDENTLFRYLDSFTPEELTAHIAAQLPAKYLNRKELEKAILGIVSRTYNKYFPDYGTGSGWFPPYDNSVNIIPPISTTEIKERTYPDRYNIEIIWAIEHDIRFNKIRTEKTNTYKTDSQNLSCFRLALAESENITPSQMERFWSQLQTSKHPVIFEIVGNGTANTITFQFLCHQTDKRQIANQLTNLFPSSNINTEGTDPDALREQVGDDYQEKLLKDFDTYGVSFGLARHYTYQLRTLTTFDKTDPLQSLIESLGDLSDNEGAVIQALITPAGKAWLDNLEPIEAISKHDRLLFGGCPASTKANSPLTAVSLKAMVFRQRNASQRRFQFETIENAFSSFRVPKGNHLSTTPEELSEKIQKENERLEKQSEALRKNYSDEKIIERGYNLKSLVPEIYNKVWFKRHSELSRKELLAVLDRNTYRHGFILNTQELASLCHFPHKAIEHPKLLRESSTFAQAPEHLTQAEGLLIGINEVFGKKQEVYIPEDFRFRHTYVVGKTGTGKTTFLFNMIAEDIKAGKGVGLIDPHGDLVEQVLTAIPKNRINDVILFDPSDYEQPIGFNMFQVNSPQERRQMRADILTSIKRFFDDASWGDNIDQLFRVSIATLLADETQTHTIADIRRLISDDVFRSQILRRISDDYLQEFWREDFTGFTQATISAMRRRLGSILSEPEVRNTLTQTQTSFSFKDMMDTKKILLAKLSRGTLGEDISKVFGGLLVSKIQLTAMAREAQPEHTRVPFYLYVDEFQNFVNESFEVILSEARKYKLCLTMAHQFTGQLPKPVYDAVFGNVGTLIAFETGVHDATALEKQLGKFSQEDILNLPQYHTFTRIGKSQDTFSMRTLPPAETEEDLSEEVRRASREKYGRPIPESKPQENPDPEPINTPVEPEPTREVPKEQTPDPVEREPQKDEAPVTDEQPKAEPVPPDLTPDLSFFEPTEKQEKERADKADEEKINPSTEFLMA